MTTIKCSIENLRAGLDAVTLASGEMLPDTKAVKLEAVANVGQLQLYCFNGSLAGRALVPAQVDGDLAVSVSAAILRQVVSAMGKTGEISLALKDGKKEGQEVKDDEGKLLVKSGGSKSTLNIMDASIPGFPQLDGGLLFQISGVEMGILFRLTRFVCRDISRPNLGVLHVEAKATENAKAIFALAADGFAAARCGVTSEKVYNGKVDLPLQFVQVVDRLIQGDDMVVLRKLEDGKHVIQVTNDKKSKDLAFIGVGIEQEFPLDMVIQAFGAASGHKSSVVAPLTEFSRAVAQAQALESKELYISVNGSLQFASTETEFGQARLTIPGAQMTGEAYRWLGATMVKNIVDAAAVSGTDGNLTMRLESQAPMVAFTDGFGFEAVLAGLQKWDKVEFAVAGE